MESLLGFKETTSDIVNPDANQSCSYKLVPWISWDEWESVRDSLFSSSPHSIASALRKIKAWRSRGCLPIVIEVTASIVDIQQKDPFFRLDFGDDASGSEEMLAMLYCMAIMRLVNGVVEKTRKKTEVSIAEAADAINIPRMLVDIRHEGSHRDLPSLRLVRLASIKAIDWLKSYYWEPQKEAIQFQNDGTASLRKEIKSRLYELAFCLQMKQATGSISSLDKGKRIKHSELFCGRNKFLHFKVGKSHSSKSAGSKKQITKALKHFVRVYCSYSSEVVSVLVELLLKGSDYSDFNESTRNYQVSHSTNHTKSVFDVWKPAIEKLSNKQPELLLNLIKAVLEMIDTQEARKYESEYAISENTSELHLIEKLSELLEWLVKHLKGLKPRCGKDPAAAGEDSSSDIRLPKSTLVELLRKSLQVSCRGNNRLYDSSLLLAQMIGNSYLIQKLYKPCLLGASNSMIDEDKSHFIDSESILARHEDSIHQASEKLELVKLGRMKSNVLKTTGAHTGRNSIWVVAKSWNSCPIGTLPRDVGSSGRLPVLDCDDDNEEVLKILDNEERWSLNECTRKRGPECDVELSNDSHIKKMRETEGALESNGKDDTLSQGVKGHLMIGGVRKKVGEDELLAITTAVRILV